MRIPFFRFSFIAALLFLVSLGSTHAQELKFGYVNSLEVLSLMPESKTADSLLVAYQSEYQEQYDRYIAAHQTLAAELNNPASALSEVARETKTEDLKALESRIMEFEAGAQAKLEERRNEIFRPVLEQATALIAEVADDEGYYYIFDTSSGAIAFAPAGDNVIELVKAKIEAAP